VDYAYFMAHVLLELSGEYFSTRPTINVLTMKKDRNAIALARMNSLEEDLNLSSTKYQTCVSILSLDMSL
jgi:hypothetical protein